MKFKDFFHFISILPNLLRIRDNYQFSLKTLSEIYYLEEVETDSIEILQDILKLKYLKTLTFRGEISRSVDQYNNLTEVTISIKQNIDSISIQHKSLEHLKLYYTSASLVNLDCPKLKSLFLNHNDNVRTLDLSKLPSLQILKCPQNQLEELNTQKNTQLHTLALPYNKLKFLKINKGLKKLNADHNLLTTISFSSHKQLQSLSAINNNFQSLNLKLPKLKFIDISQNTCSLDVNLSKCSSLNKVVLYSSHLKTINLPESVTEVDLCHNQLKYLKITSFSLYSLRCIYNQITHLSLNTPYLSTLRAGFNPIQKFEIQLNPLVERNRFQLPKLSISKNNHELIKILQEQELDFDYIEDSKLSEL